MFLIGIHGPNQQYRENPISERAWALMGFLRPAVTAVKGFSYWSLSDWLRAVEILMPRMVVIRLNHPDDLPTLADLYRSNILQGIDVIVEVLNEPNHPNEGFPRVIDFNAKLLTSIGYLRAICPEWRIAYPGLSPSYEYQSWWAGSADLIDLCDVLCIHLYYNEPGNIKQQDYHLAEARSIAGNKPIIVSEFCYTGGEAGRVRPTTELAPEYAEAAQWLSDEGAEAMFYYILESDDPHWHEVGEVFDEYLARYTGQIKLEAGMNEQIQMLLAQNALLTQALIAFREGRFEGANGIDGIIVALNGGQVPENYAPIYPPA